MTLWIVLAAAASAATCPQWQEVAGGASLEDQARQIAAAVEAAPLRQAPGEAAAAEAELGACREAVDREILRENQRYITAHTEARRALGEMLVREKTGDTQLMALRKELTAQQRLLALKRQELSERRADRQRIEALLERAGADALLIYENLYSAFLSGAVVWCGPEQDVTGELYEDLLLDTLMDHTAEVGPGVYARLLERASREGGGEYFGELTLDRSATLLPLTPSVQFVGDVFDPGDPTRRLGNYRVGYMALLTQPDLSGGGPADSRGLLQPSGACQVQGFVLSGPESPASDPCERGDTAPWFQALCADPTFRDRLRVGEGASPELSELLALVHQQQQAGPERPGAMAAPGGVQEGWMAQLREHREGVDSLRAQRDAEIAEVAALEREIAALEAALAPGGERYDLWQEGCGDRPGLQQATEQYAGERAEVLSERRVIFRLSPATLRPGEDAPEAIAELLSSQREAAGQTHRTLVETYRMGRDGAGYDLRSSVGVTAAQLSRFQVLARYRPAARVEDAGTVVELALEYRLEVAPNLPDLDSYAPEEGGGRYLSRRGRRSYQLLPDYEDHFTALDLAVGGQALVGPEDAHALEGICALIDPGERPPACSCAWTGARAEGWRGFGVAWTALRPGGQSEPLVEGNACGVALVSEASDERWDVCEALDAP
jgi:hypothetical protein